MNHSLVKAPPPPPQIQMCVWPRSETLAIQLWPKSNFPSIRQVLSKTINHRQVQSVCTFLTEDGFEKNEKVETTRCGGEPVRSDAKRSTADVSRVESHKSALELDAKTICPFVSEEPTGTDSTRDDSF